MGPVGRIIVMATVVGFSIGGYWFFEQQKVNEKIDLDHKALVTAQLWVATVNFRSEPENYLIFRDSFLEANNLTEDELNALTTIESDHSMQDVYFADMVYQFVDSLVSIKDSIRLAAIADSLADSLSDSTVEPETRLDSAQVDLQ